MRFNILRLIFRSLLQVLRGRLFVRRNKEMLVAGLLLCALQGTAQAEGPQKVSALVQTAAVQHTEMHGTVTGYGAVVPEPGAMLDLNFAMAGTVTRVRVTPGQQVRRGTILLEASATPQTRQAQHQAAHAVEFAKGELARVQALFAQQLATRSQLAAAERGLKDAESNLRAQQNGGPGVRGNRLLAPFSGTVASVAVAPGDSFAGGAILVQLVHTGAMEVQLGVQPEDSGAVVPGLKVTLTPVFGHGQAVKGEVRQVSGQIDPKTQLINVRVAFKGGSLLPGTRVRGDIAVDRREVQAVPRPAVLKDEGGAYLFQLKDGTAHRVAVTTGLDDGTRVEVVTPVLQDWPVVTLGNYELQDGMAIREQGR